jgi:hypothetical protein
MKDMMLVETRDPIECRDVEWSAILLSGLSAAGVGCTLMLAENGVLAARGSARGNLLSGLVDSGVEILADRFALAERGIADSELTAGVAGADLGVVIDRLAAGNTVIWR